MIKRILAVIFVALLHLILSVVIYGKAEVIEQTTDTAVWHNASKVIAFPILWLIRIEEHVHVPRIFGLDWFPILMVLNSLFWGTVIVMLLFWVKKRGWGGPREPQQKSS